MPAYPISDQFDGAAFAARYGLDSRIDFFARREDDGSLRLHLRPGLTLPDDPLVLPVVDTAAQAAATQTEATARARLLALADKLDAGTIAPSETREALAKLIRRQLGSR